MLQLLPNPDNVPSAVTTGYQRQNTNLFAIQTGIDTTKPFDNGEGTITIPYGSIIETNGVLYKITSEINLNKPEINTAYWIEIFSDNDTATAQLVTRPGKWNNSKQGFYSERNNRVINWVSLGDISIDDNLNNIEYISPTVKGTYNVVLSAGFKIIEIASGLGNGNGANGNNATSNIGGNGGIGAGIAATSSVKKMLFESNGREKLTIYIGASGENGSGNGGNGGGTYRQGGGGGGGGGAGASGAGEASYILLNNEQIINSGSVPRGSSIGGTGYPTSTTEDDGSVYTNAGGGKGGNAGQAGSAGQSGGYPNTSGGSGGTYPSGNGGVGSSNGSNFSSGSGGGGGGSLGADGSARPDGSPGGYCIIYTL